MADDTGVFDTTSPVLMFHPNLFTARKFKRPDGKETGEPMFSASLGIGADHPDLAAMKKVTLAVIRAKWPTRDLKTLVLPFKNGDALADKAKAKVEAKVAKAKLADYNRGLVVIKTKSKFPPRLSVVMHGKIIGFDSTEAALEYKDKFFFGAEILARLNFAAYEGVNDGPDGVNVYLNQVLSTGKGTRIGGFASAEETFRNYVGTLSAEDPTAGMSDDEIPF